MRHNVGETVSMDREAFLKALEFRGDRLELHRFGDGFTRVEEFDGDHRIYKAMVLDTQADIIEENFTAETGGQGTVQWK